MIDPTAVPFYKPEEIEAKWQARWEADKLYQPWRDPDKPSSTRLPCCPTPAAICTSVTGTR